MIWDIFVIAFASAAVVWLYVVTIYKRDMENYVEWKEDQRWELKYKRDITPRFNASEYLERIEKVFLETLETRQPISRSITLWWGLDGLRLNEDGTTEWISRKKTNPADSVFYQTCQSILPLQTGTLLYSQFADSMQCAEAEINKMMMQNAALQMQARQSELNERIIKELQKCCVQYIAHDWAMYPESIYGGCCCNFMG